MAGTTKLVIGASGFLGSHVTRQLVAAGHAVRVMLRHTSSTRAIDDLDVELCFGDVFDDRALADAMAGCDVVYHCVVDARMWLRDPAQLFRTNVEGLRHVLDAAVAAELTKFVYTSTTGTLAISTASGGPGSVPARPVTEDDPHNWTDGGPYIEARIAGEDLVFAYARDHGLPAVALCISTTYGPRDWQPTPHGGLLASVAAGRFPFYFGYSAEVVGIEDAARAMLAAAEHGTPGERYIVSDRYTSSREVHEIAAEAVGVRPPRIAIPLGLLYAGSRVNDVAARLLRRDLVFAHVGIRMAELMSELDHSKAERELGWTPRPTAESIRSAARWFVEHRTG